MKTFPCENCKEYKPYISCVPKYSLRYYCDYCWKTYKKRLKEILNGVKY